jgi:CheY-like chemotaxis protein
VVADHQGRRHQAGGMTMVSPTRILLVEDSLLFRVLAVEQLENLGFVIETAETAAEAMTKLQQGDGT